MLLAGCAFSSVDRANPDKYQSAISSSEPLTTNPTAAMDASKSALEAIGYEVLSVSPELGSVRTKVRAVRVPDNCHCGTWNGNVVSGNANSTIILKAVAQSTGGALIGIGHSCNVNFSGRNLFGGV